MPNQNHESLILIDDIVNAYVITDNISNVVKNKYFVDTLQL